MEGEILLGALSRGEKAGAIRISGMMRSILLSLCLSLLVSACADEGAEVSESDTRDAGLIRDAEAIEAPRDAGDSAVRPSDAGDVAGPNDAGDAAISDGALPEEDDPEPGWYRFDAARCGAHVFLDETGVTMERTAIAPEACGSAAGIAAYSGVFYAEFERLAGPGGAAFGIGPSGMDVGRAVGSGPSSAALIDGGAIALEGDILPSSFDASTRFYGVIIDRRGEDPMIYFIASEGRIVGRFLMEDFQGEVYLYASGPRLALGPQARLNAGEDLRTRPFIYDARAALEEVDEEAAAALNLGLRERPLRAPDEPPRVELSGPDEVALGETIALQLSAIDHEDGDLGGFVRLEDDARVYSDRQIELEDGVYYRGTIVGEHQLRASVRDSRGQLGEALHTVRVIGEVERAEEPRLSIAPGDGVMLSADGLGVRFTRTEKIGVRGDTPIFGDFRYFEVSHQGHYGNFGAGIVSGEGALIPYALRNVPASASLNFISGIWRNLIHFASYPEDEPREVVGFAVDYRGTSPIVHIIINHGLRASVPIPELKTPAYPMLYGSMSAGNGPQLRANFGGEPFEYEPRLILGEVGIDGVRLGLIEIDQGED